MSRPALGDERPNPYPGLRPFRDDEAHLFFGREKQVGAMIAKLRATHFLAVVGASGSGKSSLVNCGLLPALRAGQMPGAGTQWRMAVFRPGNRVMRSLASALCAPGALYGQLQSQDFSPSSLVEATLRSSRLGLIDAFEEAHVPPGTQLLVVADQFEELFRYRSLSPADGPRAHDYGPSADAVAFVNLLLAVREKRECPIHVVITMRSDFLGDCAQFEGLPEALNASQYLVPRLTRDERRMAIAGPAGVEGATISPVLLTRLVNDVGDNPDQLSILQHALNRTWACWASEGARGDIELRHYEAIGTMSSALDSHANDAFGELDGAQQVLAERLFKVLTDSGTDPRGIRRPTTFAALREITAADPGALLAVMEAFRKPSRSFLMPPLGDKVEDSTVVDISHESLMRVWQQLQRWSAEEAQSAQMLRRLADSAHAYPERESLWQDPKLTLALNWEQQQKPNQAWARLYDVELEPVMAFLRASDDARAEAAAQAAAKAQAAESRTRRRRLVAVGSVIGALVAALAFTNWRNTEISRAAERERKAAEEKLQLAKSVEQANEEKNVALELFKMISARFGSDVDPKASAEAPALLGLSIKDAQLALEQLKLGSGDVSEVAHSSPPGTVVAQLPTPPTRVALGDPVYLVVATTKEKAEANRRAAEAAQRAATPLPGAAPAVAAAAVAASMAEAASAATNAGPPAVPGAVTQAPKPAAPSTAKVSARRTPAQAEAPRAKDAMSATAATVAAAAPPASAECPSTGDWSTWLGNSQFQTLASQQKENGNYPARIEGRLAGDQLQFRAIFAPVPPNGFNWDIYRSDKDLETLRKVRGERGFVIQCKELLQNNPGAPRWQVTWRKKPS